MKTQINSKKAISTSKRKEFLEEVKRLQRESHIAYRKTVKGGGGSTKM